MIVTDAINEKYVKELSKLSMAVYITRVVKPIFFFITYQNFDQLYRKAVLHSLYKFLVYLAFPYY